MTVANESKSPWGLGSSGLHYESYHFVTISAIQPQEMSRPNGENPESWKMCLRCCIIVKRLFVRAEAWLSYHCSVFWILRLFNIRRCVCACAYGYVHMSAKPRRDWRIQIPPEQELQIVNFLTQVLEMELQSSITATNILNCWAVSGVPIAAS